MGNASHQDLHAAADELPQSPDRSFGLVFTVVFLVIAVLPSLREGQSVRYWALAVSAMLLAVSLTAPHILAPANGLWMRLALLLNKIVSPVVMGILFFLVATPTAFFMRLAGKDPLRLPRDPNATTYWISRTPPGPPAESMRNQF